MSYIYILSNKSMPGLLKIGMTMDAPEKRAAQLSSTGVPSNFVVEAYWKIPETELRRTEQLIHKLFDKHRLRSNREFFSLSVEDAKRHIAEYFKHQDDLEKKRIREAEQKRRKEKLITDIGIFMQKITAQANILEHYIESTIPAASVIKILHTHKPKGIHGKVVSFSGWEISASFSYSGGDGRPSALQKDNPQLYISIPAEVEVEDSTWLTKLLKRPKAKNKYGGYFAASYYLYGGNLSSTVRVTPDGLEKDDMVLNRLVDNGLFPRNLQEFLAKAGLSELETERHALFDV